MTASQLLVSHHKDPGRVRDHQEDNCANFAIHHGTGDYQLLIVADGMGGHAHGEVASKLAMDTLAQFIQYGSWTDPASALRDGYALANERVHAQGEDMGTTLTAVLFHEATGQYWWANVGDSRAYLLEGATLTQLSRDHSEIQVRVDAGQLTQEEARLTKGRNVLLKAIGPSARVEADVAGPFELRRGQRLLLCSDGLHGMLPDAEIAAIAQHDLQVVAKDLVAAANVAGGRDNIAALVAALASGEATQWMGPPPAVVVRPVSAVSRAGKFVLAAAAVGVVFLVAGVLLALTSGGDDDEEAGGIGAAGTSSAVAPKATETTPAATPTNTPSATPSAPATETTTTAVGAATPATSTPTPRPPTPTLTPNTPPSPAPTSTPTPTATPSPTTTPVPKPAAPTMTLTIEGSSIRVTWAVSSTDNIDSFKVLHWRKSGATLVVLPEEEKAKSVKSVNYPVPQGEEHCFEVHAIGPGTNNHADSERACLTIPVEVGPGPDGNPPAGSPTAGQPTTPSPKGGGG